MRKAGDTATVVVKRALSEQAQASEGLGRTQLVALALPEALGAVYSAPALVTTLPLRSAPHRPPTPDSATIVALLVEDCSVRNRPEVASLAQPQPRRLNQAVVFSVLRDPQALALVRGQALGPAPLVVVFSALTVQHKPTTLDSNSAEQQLVVLGNQPQELLGSRIQQAPGAYLEMPPRLPRLLVAANSKQLLPIRLVVLARLRAKATQAPPLEVSGTASHSRNPEDCSATLGPPIPGAGCSDLMPIINNKRLAAFSVIQVITSRLGADCLVTSQSHLGPVEAYLEI